MLLDHAKKYNQGGEVITEYGWDYKKEGDNYLTKKSDDTEWITAKGRPLQHIKAKIYKEEDAIQAIERDKPTESKPKDASSSTTSTPTESKTKFSYTPGKGGWEQTMQEFLVSKGYNLGNTGVRGKGIDGAWGPKSQAALDDWVSKEDPMGLPQITTDKLQESCTPGKGCAYMAGAKVASLMGGAAEPGSDIWVRNAWFNKDYHIRDGGDLLYNEPKRGGMGYVPKELYGTLRVGDYVSLNRAGNPNKGDTDEDMPWLKNEEIEHLGMIIGKDERGVPMVYHGSKTGNAYIQPIDKAITLPDIGNKYWISSITRPSGLKEATFDHLETSPYHFAMEADPENELIAGPEANPFQQQALNTVNENVEDLMRQGFSQDDVNLAAQVLMGISEMESTGNESWGRVAKEGAMMWYKNFTPDILSKLVGSSIDLPFEVEIGGRKLDKIPTPGAGEASRGPYQIKPHMHFGTNDEPTRLGKKMWMTTGISPDEVGGVTGSFDNDIYTIAGMTLLLDNLNYLKNHEDYDEENNMFQGVSLPYALAKTWQAGSGYVNIKEKSDLLKDYDITYSEKALPKSLLIAGTEQNDKSISDSVKQMEKGILDRETRERLETQKAIEEFMDMDLEKMFRYSPPESTSTWASESTYVDKPFVNLLEANVYKKGGPTDPDTTKKPPRKLRKNDPELKNWNRFNTKLWPWEKRRFKEWTDKEGNLWDRGAYDIQGFWKNTIKKDIDVTDEDGHGPDTWKKPNHPTFSNQSKYAGRQGNEGGIWKEDGAYYPSEKTKQLYGGKGFYDWFFSREPNRPEHYGPEYKKGGKVNPWAICTSSVGRSDKEKYERCVKKVKKKHGLIDTIK